MSQQGQAPRVGAAKYTRVVKGGDFLKPKKWENWSEGDFVEGEYVNASETDLYGKPIYEIKVENKKITGNDPTILTGAKAGIMPLYPNGSLMMQMDFASYGDKVRIEYKGMATTSKGKFKGKPCHSIEVGIEGFVHPDEAAETTSDDNLLG